MHPAQRTRQGTRPLSAGTCGRPRPTGQVQKGGARARAVLRGTPATTGAVVHGRTRVGVRSARNYCADRLEVAPPVLGRRKRAQHQWRAAELRYRAVTELAGDLGDATAREEEGKGNGAVRRLTLVACGCSATTGRTRGGRNRGRRPAVMLAVIRG